MTASVTTIQKRAAAEPGPPPRDGSPLGWAHPPAPLPYREIPPFCFVSFLFLPLVSSGSLVNLFLQTRDTFFELSKKRYLCALWSIKLKRWLYAEQPRYITLLTSSDHKEKFASSCTLHEPEYGRWSNSSYKTVTHHVIFLLHSHN